MDLYNMTDDQLRGQAQYYGISTVNPNGSPIDHGRLIENIQERQAVIESNAKSAVNRGSIRNKSATSSISLPKPPSPPASSNIPVKQKPPAARGRPATRTRQPVTLPLESDLGTLSEIRTFVGNVFYGNPNAPLINPKATFANVPILPPPKKPLPRGRPKLPVPKIPIAATTTGPKIPINVLPPMTLRPVQNHNQQPPSEIKKSPINTVTSRETIGTVPPLVLQRKRLDGGNAILPAESSIPDKITIPLTPTKLDTIPLPEPQEAEVQLQVAQTSKQRAVFNIGSIDRNRLTAGRASRSNNTKYTLQEMKKIANDLGLDYSVGKKELYKKIMDELRNHGIITEDSSENNL